MSNQLNEKTMANETQSQIALNIMGEETFVTYFLVAKKGKSDTKESFLTKLPNRFTDNSLDARKFDTEKEANTAMLKITTYGLDPQRYSVKKYHFHNAVWHDICK